MELSSEPLAEIRELIARGELAQAQHRVQESLAQHPHSAVLHALMGDIAAARRQPREAIDWYALSLRLEDNPEVRARLQQQQELLAAVTADAQPAEPTSTRQRLIWMIVGGFIAVALILTGLGILASRRPPSEPRRPSVAPVRPAEQPFTGPSQAASPPRTVVAPSRPPSAASAPLPAPSARAAVPAPAMPAPSGNVLITQSLEAPLSDRDRLLTQALSGVTWPTGEALGWRVQAIVDDFTGYAMITVQTPRSLRIADVPGVIIDMAYKIAVAAIQADSGLLSLTVRILMPVESDGKKKILLAFRGNTTREHLEYYLKRGQQPDRNTIWNHIFATTWWNPSVSAASPETP